MQCPRCYFSNAPTSPVCEYCGARLEPTTEAPSAGSAASKRKTMLGPTPRFGPGPEVGPPRPRLDPEDPFRIAAQGIAAPRPAEPSPQAGVPTPPPAPAAQTIAPVAPIAEAPGRSPAPPRPHRATVVTLPQPELAPLAGVALVIAPDGATRAVVLREGRTRIGRRADADIPVDDPQASSDHALLRIEGGNAWILDTSANGTRVSGVACINDRVDVRDGSVLEIGDSLIVLKLLGEDSLALLTRAR